jgi:hypothetical protein
MSTKPSPDTTPADQPTSDQPTTEEALPNVDLNVDPEAERISRETLGPEAVHENPGAIAPVRRAEEQ